MEEMKKENKELQSKVDELTIENTKLRQKPTAIRAMATVPMGIPPIISPKLKTSAFTTRLSTK